jgi:hypothetical protein
VQVLFDTILYLIALDLCYHIRIQIYIRLQERNSIRGRHRTQCIVRAHFAIDRFVQQYIARVRLENQRASKQYLMLTARSINDVRYTKKAMRLCSRSCHTV